MTERLGFFGKLRLALKAVQEIEISADPNQFSDAAQGMVAGFVGPNRRHNVPRDAAGLLKLCTESPLLQMVQGKIGDRMAALDWGFYAPPKGKREPRNFARMKALKKLEGWQRNVRRKAMVEAGDLEEIEDYPAAALIKSPNPLMLGEDLFTLHQLYFDVVGESYWVLDVDGLGIPTRAWPIPSTWVTGVPTVGHPKYQISVPSFPMQEIDADRIVCHRKPHPLEPYTRGVGIGRTIADELEVHERGSKMVSAFFDNSAKPEILIHGPGMTQVIATALEQAWLDRLQGYMKRHRPMFVGMPKDSTITTFDQDYKALDLVKLLDRERDLVLQVYGAPPEEFGILESSNRATSETASYRMDKGVICPRADRFRGFFQHRIMPRFDDRVMFDYESPLKEDGERQAKARTDLYMFLTVNEHRAELGQDPIPGPEGDFFLMPASVKVVSDLKTASLPPEGEQPPAPGDVPVDGPMPADAAGDAGAPN